LSSLQERTKPKDRLEIYDLEVAKCIQPIKNLDSAEEEVEQIEIGNFSTAGG